MSPAQAQHPHPQSCILLDAGNSRIKWIAADVEGQALRESTLQAVNTADCSSPQGLTQLAVRIANTAVQVQASEVWVCQVLGPDFALGLERALTTLGLTLRACVPGASKRLATAYRQPERLGQDRWAACMALAGPEVPGALHCVVSFGTATTVDAVLGAQVAGLHAQHTHLHAGGLILPGLGLMLSSLHQRTAQLPQAQLNVQAWPDNTDSAIASGVVRAQWSTVQGFCDELQRQYKQTPSVWVHGGFVEMLLPHAPLGCLLLENAVFKGLLRIALDEMLNQKTGLTP